MFRFVQLEFGFLLGPADGRYLIRPGAGAEPTHVVVLRTMGSPERRLLRGRRPAAVDDAVSPEPVPTSRATVIDAAALDSEASASGWLDSLRRDEDALGAELGWAVRVLNGVLHAHRAAALDPYARDVSAAAALVARVGYGAGEQVAEGRFSAAIEPPRGTLLGSVREQRRQSHLAPQERLASVLGGRDHVLAGEELYLRARADLTAGRSREAALQARIALEALLAELRAEGRDVASLGDLRGVVGDAANAALAGDLTYEQTAAVVDATDAMERALRKRAANA